MHDSDLRLVLVLVTEYLDAPEWSHQEALAEAELRRASVAYDVDVDYLISRELERRDMEASWN